MQTDANGTEKSALEFRSFENPAMFSRDRRLICPQCGELLGRTDVEGFYTCPFCLFRFEPTAELEDFILEPEVDSWMKLQPGFTFQMLNHLAHHD